MKKRWQSYEEVAAYLLNHFAERFGLERVEGKQKLNGQRTGAEWEIDAKGVCVNGSGFVIVECRRYTTSKQNQEKLSGLAFRIIDTGAQGGIIVSPLGLQAGAAKIASSEKIQEVKLDANSTPTEFAIEFLGKMMIGAGITEHIKLGVTVRADVIRTCKSCGERFTVEENEKICNTCRQIGVT